MRRDEFGSSRPAHARTRSWICPGSGRTRSSSTASSRVLDDRGLLLQAPGRAPDCPPRGSAISRAAPGAEPRDSATRTSSIVSLRRGRKRTCWHRETIVGSNADGSSAVSTRCVPGGGSSISFSADCAASSSIRAASVEDEDAPAPFRQGPRRLDLQFADPIDPDRGVAGELEQMVSVRAVFLKPLGDLVRTLVLVARRREEKADIGMDQSDAIFRHGRQASARRIGPIAVERLGEAEGGPGLADAARTVEKVGLGNAVLSHGGAQALDRCRPGPGSRRRSALSAGAGHGDSSQPLLRIHRLLPAADLEVEAVPFTESVSPTSAIFWPSATLRPFRHEHPGAMGVEGVVSRRRGSR